jgi:hypothetical protein
MLSGAVRFIRAAPYFLLSYNRRFGLAGEMIILPEPSYYNLVNFTVNLPGILRVLS